MVEYSELKMKKIDMLIFRFYACMQFACKVTTFFSYMQKNITKFGNFSIF